LDAEREVLYDRINQRVDLMMAERLLAEAETLYPQRHLNALQTVGYRELFAYLDGTVTLEEAVEAIKINTRRFAKRQLTWFKRTEAAHWFDYQTELTQITNTIDLLVSPNSEAI
jgi:tRNA dimethylallyltransferase